jgi:hypothetical protein
MQVRIGRVRANDKLALHLEIDGSTCASNREIHVTATTATAGMKRCKSCFRPARWEAARKLVAAALDAIRKASANAYNRGRDLALTAANELLSTDAELARSAELVARWHAAHAVPVAEVRELSPFGEAVARIGAVVEHKRPTNITAPSKRKRLALANSFAHAA